MCSDQGIVPVYVPSSKLTDKKKRKRKEKMEKEKEKKLLLRSRSGQLVSSRSKSRVDAGIVAWAIRRRGCTCQGCICKVQTGRNSEFFSATPVLDGGKSGEEQCASPNERHIYAIRRFCFLSPLKSKFDMSCSFLHCS